VDSQIGSPKSSRTPDVSASLPLPPQQPHSLNIVHELTCEGKGDFISSIIQNQMSKKNGGVSLRDTNAHKLEETTTKSMEDIRKVAEKMLTT
jgi:hypothetical protein